MGETMKVYLKIISLLLILCLFSIASVYANEDNNITDENLQMANNNNLEINYNDVNNNASNTKTFDDLNELIQSSPSGSTVNLESDYEYNEGFDTNGINLNNTLTIAGNGHVLDGKNSGRIFFIKADNVILKNITFQNGYSSESEGAVGCRGNNLSIIDCTFINNYANGTSSLDAKKVVGGGVYIYANNAKIINNKFINNSIRGSGAGLALDGYYHVIENNTFIANNAFGGMNGGGVLIGRGYQITIRSNTFINNSAEMGGGGIELQHSENDLIENNIFINNLGDYGGAISIYNTSYFKISENLFIDSHATLEDSPKGLGGAIRVYLNDSSHKSYITKNKFLNSTAIHYGAAIYSYGDNLEISYNTFNNSLAENKVGGTIDIVGNNISIINNYIANTFAGRHGGAIGIDGSNNVIAYNNFVNSISMIGGGAISINGNSTIIDNNNFTNTTSNGDSGSIQIIGDNTIISNNQFIKSTAQINGGAIYICGNENTISNNYITQTSAKNKGGAIYSEGYNSKILSNTIDNTYAGSSAGSIYLIGNSATIDNNQFTNSISQNFAGGIQLNGNNAVISNNNFEKNIASSHSGSLYVIGSNAKITNNKFTKNTASSNGGAVRVDGIKATITSNVFKNNVASKGSDVYLWQADHSKISGNTFNKYVSMSVVTYGNYIALQDNKGNVEKTILVVSNKNFGVTQTKSFTVTLKNSKGNVITGKTVFVTVNGKTYKAATNSKGQATVKFSLKTMKSYKCSIKFAKDSYNKASSKTVTVKVVKSTTKLTIPAKTFKKSEKTKKVVVTLTAYNKAVSKKKVTLNVNGKNYKATTNSKGQATINVKLTKKGTFKYTAKFSGNSQYKSVTKTGKIVIK